MTLARYKIGSPKRLYMLFSKRGSFIGIGMIIVSLCLGVFVQSVTADVTGALLPQSDGVYTQWTPKTGTSHFAMVDESVCNGTTDYNFTPTSGNRDSYGIGVASSTVPNGAVITQIAIRPCASRNNSGGGGSATLDVFYRFGGVDSADAGAYALPAGTTPSELATTTFSSLALLQTSTSTLEIGAVYSAGNKGIRLSRIATTITYSPLTAPSNLTGVATTSSSIGLTWSDNSLYEDGFTVERSTNGADWIAIATTTASTTSYYDSGLTASTTYHHRIRAFNFGAYSAYSNVAITKTLDTPATAPSDLSATASTTARVVALAWTDNASNESNFEVVRGTDGISFAHLATTSANITSYSDTTVATSTTYHYKVRAYNSAGYSSFTNVASTTTFTIPLAPSDLTLSTTYGTTTADITLDWVDNADNELNFEIQRSTGGTFFHLASTTANTTSYVDLGLAVGSTTYSYRVRSWNGYGFSGFSNTASTTP